MKTGSNGYSLIEVLIALPILALASIAASTSVYQIITNIQKNNDHITAVRQVDNAGYWISRDASMAVDITTSQNLSAPDFLLLQWTSWNVTTGIPVYFTARYSIENQVNGTGTLKRYYSSSTGANQTMQVAQYIYFDANSQSNSSESSYENPVLNVKLSSVIGKAIETKEYNIRRRPDY